MGHVKVMTLENTLGNYRPVILRKYFGTGCVRMINKTSAGGNFEQNLGNSLCLSNDSWFYIEVHINISSGIYELWMDDCGSNGAGCNGTARTKRASHSGISFGSETIGTAWLENWGNPSSTGGEYYGRFVVSTRRIGPMNGSTIPRPSPPVLLPD